ncbi:MAG TPA: hypothetical protein VFP22_02760 [Candidatus Limnocylindrales bacterium]|nr:hypothetical protein [Candidatus Limnocylindrales bacterium]
MIFEPTSRVLDSVNVPPTQLTLESLQEIVASLPIVALSPAAEALPLTVAADIVPLPVASRPLSPGPAARTEAGANAATISIDAAAIHPAFRTKEPRRVRRVVPRAFIRSPRVAWR